MRIYDGLSADDRAIVYTMTISIRNTLYSEGMHNIINDNDTRFQHLEDACSRFLLQSRKQQAANDFAHAAEQAAEAQKREAAAQQALDACTCQRED